MKMLLYTLDQPQGRCLLLAQELLQVTNLAASESLQIAERIFASHHARTNPVVIDLSEGTSAVDLEAICLEMGILIECVELRGSVIPR